MAIGRGAVESMRVFVTGHLGYIGSHLVDVLRAAGHRVTGCDLGLFKGCEWEPLAQPNAEMVKDIAAITERDLDGHDAICHLAAISNDPMGELNSEITLTVNRDKSLELARKAKAVGVGRFLFAGSCSVYGAGDKRDLKTAPIQITRETQGAPRAHHAGQHDEHAGERDGDEIKMPGHMTREAERGKQWRD